MSSLYKCILPDPSHGLNNLVKSEQQIFLKKDWCSNPGGNQQSCYFVVEVTFVCLYDSIYQQNLKNRQILAHLT